MLGNKIWCMIILTLILLLAITTSVLAAEFNHIFEISNSDNDPSQYQLNLLLTQINNYNPSLSVEQKKAVCISIFTEAKSTGFDPFFISSIIAAESSFCPNAVSPCEALGLMQLTSCVSTTMHINNPFNIQENIYAGTRFLKYLKNRFGDNNLVLAAYNAGPTRVARLGRVPNIKETLCYVKKVNMLYHTLQQELYSLIQKSINRLILCQVFTTITDKNIPNQTVRLKELSSPSPIFTADFYLCEAERSIRFIVNT